MNELLQTRPGINYIELQQNLIQLACKVAALNPAAGEIGPGMLANLVAEARQLITLGIVISGPQGCGKTSNADALAAHYGKTRILDNGEWLPGYPLPADTLALTSIPDIPGAIPFETAMAACGINYPSTVNPANTCNRAE